MLGERSVFLGLTFIFAPVGPLPFGLAQAATLGLAVSFLIPALAFHRRFIGARLRTISIIAPTRPAHANQHQATMT